MRKVDVAVCNSTKEDIRRLARKCNCSQEVIVDMALRDWFAHMKRFKLEKWWCSWLRAGKPKKSKPEELLYD